MNYGAGTIKRTRRTTEQVAMLDAQIMDVLREDNPQSVRHVFYRMTDPRLAEPVEKSDRGYRQVQHRITELRRDGTLPYGWITDATRRGYHVNTYANAADALRHWQSYYRADLWQMADHYVEVWCESRSIAGVIEDTCEDLAVSLYPCGGFSSISLAYQAAEYINHRAADIPATVIYIGDYDPAGVLIDESLQRELRCHLHPHIDLEFNRIAITQEQIQELDLPTKARKKGDKRSMHITSTVEAEAMPAKIMRELLRAEIEKYLPTDALRIAKVAEQSEREGLLMLAASLEAEQ